MSELNGLFQLRRPRDLVEKLVVDLERIREADVPSILAQYAAFDFFVTAEHLVDWLVNTGKYIGTLQSLSESYPDGLLVSHVANGFKHFRVSTDRHTTVKETRTARAFQNNAFQNTAFQTTPRLVIDLEDGTSEDVLEVASRVLEHWESEVP